MYRNVLNELIKLQETNEQKICSLDAKYCGKLAFKYENFSTFQKQVEALTMKSQK